MDVTVWGTIYHKKTKNIKYKKRKKERKKERKNERKKERKKERKG